MELLEVVKELAIPSGRDPVVNSAVQNILKQEGSGDSMDLPFATCG